MNVAYPWILALLWVVPALAAWWFVLNRRREQRLAVFMAPVMQAKLRPPAATVRFAWQVGLVAAGLFLAVIAAARPRWGQREEVVFTRGRDIVIALDVSRSMLANDVYPNRLERAKVDIMDLIRDLRGDRAALVAFRQKAVLVCPLTTDYAYLKQAVDAVNISSAPRGETDIGDAIVVAMDAFDKSEGSHKAVVLISDGEDLSGRAVALAEEAGKRKIPIFTVGLGSTRGARIPDPETKDAFTKYEGTEVVSHLNNETLDAVARASGGAYVPVGTASTGSTTLGALYRNRLRQLAAQDFEETLQRRYIERYPIFLLPALALLLAGAGLSRGRLATRRAATAAATAAAGTPTPRRNLAPPAAALLLLAVAGLARAQTNPAPFVAPVPLGPAAPPRAAEQTAATTNTTTPAPRELPDGRAGARLGQSLYDKGRYAEAGEAFLHAADTIGGQGQRDFRFNAAAAFYKAGQFARASSLLRDLAASRPGADVPVANGLGAALFQQAEAAKAEDPAQQAAEREKCLREAGAAFQEVLKQQPADEATRKNLAVILDALPQAEQDALVARLTQQHQQAQPFDLINQMLNEQRGIIEAIPRAYTNDSPGQVKELEQLAARQKANAQLWVPLKGKLLGATQGADPRKTAALAEMVEQTRESMLDSAGSLRDMDPAAYGAALGAEGNIYPAWKGLAPYEPLLGEDLRRQSNSLAGTESAMPAGTPPASTMVEQQEALDLTKLFTKKFTEAVPPEGTKPPPSADTNGVESATNNAAQGISPETRQKILDLADQVAKSQEQAIDELRKKAIPAAADRQQAARRQLEEIARLLPPQQQQQQQKQEQKQQEKKQEQQPPPEQKKEEEKPPPKEEERKREMNPEELRRMLEKALEREKEHEAEKQRQNEQMPMSPREKDW